MALTAYLYGHKHGKEGAMFLCHRKGRLYDSYNAGRSYERGYADGVKERLKERKAVKEVEKE